MLNKLIRKVLSYPESNNESISIPIPLESMSQTLPELPVPGRAKVNLSNTPPWGSTGGIVSGGGNLEPTEPSTPTEIPDEDVMFKSAEMPTLSSIFNNSTNVTAWNCTEGNVTELCSQQSQENEERSYWALILLLFPLFAVFGNILVILSVAKERSLQSVTNYFIVSLAVADLLVALIMPFLVYYMVNTYWGLPPYICDCYIGMDVICSTSSIFNLVAISIDRFIAVTKPISYAHHKNNNRIVFTIALVWLISIAIGIPIMAGLNNEGRLPGICAFNNAVFIISSSTFSFYIPCLIMIFLYYRIFKAIRERSKKQAMKRFKSAEISCTTIENVAETRKLAETTLGDSAAKTAPPSKPKNQVEEDHNTNNTSNSQEEDDDDDDENDMDPQAPDAQEENCHVIKNYRTVDVAMEPLNDKIVESADVLPSLQGAGPNARNGAAEGCRAATEKEIEHIPTKKKIRFQIHKKLKTFTRHPESGGAASEASAPANVVPEGGALLAKKERKAAVARFTIYKAHKASKRKREKSSAKRERKATKTLAIVLGAFLVCWVPFFTCNILDAFHKLLHYDALDPGDTAFLFTTWLGYMNSFLNPIIYTIFNPEFRKAFKKILSRQS